jgi:hypothetical protein
MESVLNHHCSEPSMAIVKLHINFLHIVTPVVVVAAATIVSSCSSC